jgi:hypothetical protein
MDPGPFLENENDRGLPPGTVTENPKTQRKEAVMTDKEDQWSTRGTTGCPAFRVFPEWNRPALPAAAGQQRVCRRRGTVLADRELWRQPE